MTGGHPAQPTGPSRPGRPLPDAVDLRLLAALGQSGGDIGLPQLAWRAGVGQREAAARLAELAEAGLPMRLVAQGDPARLWNIVNTAQLHNPQQHSAQQHSAQQHNPQPGPSSASANSAPANSAPASTAPASTAPASTAQPSSAEPVNPAATWGVPGSASWTARDQEQGAAARSGPMSGGAGAPPGDGTPAPAPRRRPPMPAGAAQPTVGLAGEQLTVTVDEVIDPADAVLAEAGFVSDPAERAVLVRTTVGNAGPAPHEAMPDLYLVLVDASGAVLPKAPLAVPGRPAHRVGVAPGAGSDGWTLFLIPTGTELAEVRWSVRPDLVDRDLSWSVG